MQMQIETRSLSRSWRRSDVRIARRRVGGARDGVGVGVRAAGARARRRGAAHALRARPGARPQPLRAWSCLCEGLAMQARTRRRACMARAQSCLCGRPRQAPAVRQQARARLTASVNLSRWSRGGCCCGNLSCLPDAAAVYSINGSTVRRWRARCTQRARRRTVRCWCSCWPSRQPSALSPPPR